MRVEANSGHREAVNLLIKKAQNGETDSVAGLYELYYDKIFRYISFKTSNTSDAEDLTEEVFLKMIQSLHRYRDIGSSFSSWIFRIAHNIVVDYYRTRSRRIVAPIDEANGVSEDSTHEIDRNLDIKTSIAKVHDAMKDLTKLQYEVMSLRFAAGLSVRETARTIGKKENAVKALQHAAIKKLRKILDSNVSQGETRDS